MDGTMKNNTSIAGVIPAYVTSTTTQAGFSAEITKQEYNAIRRMRQLKNQGKPIVIIELSERGPRVCKLKPEG